MPAPHFYWLNQGIHSAYASFILQTCESHIVCDPYIVREMMHVSDKGDNY